MSINLNDYLSKSRQINTVKGLFDHYDVALKEFGYTRHAFIFFPPHKDSYETVPICPHLDFPRKLVDTYINEKIYEVGPAFEKLKTTGTPVIWSEFLNDEMQFPKSPKLHAFINLLKTGGFEHGVTIPVFGAANSFGHFSFTRQKGEINSDDDDLMFLQHVCINLLRQYLRINKLDSADQKGLTLREKEVLSWVLKGKSNSVIADIMELSEHTVNTYIRRSCKKLGTSSKWGSAISAVLMGLIHR